MENADPYYYPPRAEHWRCSCGVMVLNTEGHDCVVKRKLAAQERMFKLVERLALAIEGLQRVPHYTSWDHS